MARQWNLVRKTEDRIGSPIGLSCGNVPEPGDSFVVTREEYLAVRAKACAHDNERVTERSSQFPGLDIEEPGSLFLPAVRNVRPSGLEGDSVD